MKDFVADALRDALGDPAVRVLGSTSVGGGCISATFRVETSAGDFFVKWNERCPGDLFVREADGLREMAAADSGLAIPRVIAAGEPRADRPALIILEYLAPGRATGDDEALGRGLASLHRRAAPEYGFAARTYCGTTPQENAWSRSWPDFYRDRRLRPLIRLADEARGMDAAARRTYERVAERLDDLLSHDSRPALIHGDLWSGNVVHTTRGPGLVDPACAYADREMEFGITTLFGGFGERFFRAYDEAWPLLAGWRERNPLYQLYHLLNHYCLFGEHYGAEALAVARRFV